MRKRLGEGMEEVVEGMEKVVGMEVEGVEVEVMEERGGLNVFIFSTLALLSWSSKCKLSVTA